MLTYLSNQNQAVLGQSTFVSEARVATALSTRGMMGPKLGGLQTLAWRPRSQVVRLTGLAR